MGTANDIRDVNWIEAFEMPEPQSEEFIPDKYIKYLQTSFGHSAFREMQWKIISSILDGARDNCAIMASGYGKSLCYQFPSVYLDTITIVVSPLTSLMQDQVLAMRRACCLGSEQMKRQLVSEVINRKYNIVFVTPDYITSESGTFLIERINQHLTLIAIDEAHCISKRGHDFLPSYQNLHKLRDLCPAVPILAITATATKQVRGDIIKSLNLRNAQIVVTGFDRPNLEFIVKRKTKVWEDIGPYITNVRIGSVIVYCISRRVTVEIASVIAANGQVCGVYHAGLTPNKRQKTHDDFLHDRIRVVVATVSIGMVINKPDVRLVIHYGVAQDVETYYQEVGRAGRDGMPAKCLMFYQEKDWTIHRMTRAKCKLIGKKKQLEKLAETMSKYVDTTQCRRHFILSYFVDDCSKLSVRADCCDNCKRGTSSLGPPINLFSKYEGLTEDGLLDITDEAFKLLSLVNELKAQYGIRKAFLILRGSKSKLLPRAFQFHSLYGSLQCKSEKWLQAVSNRLQHIQMLTTIDEPSPNNSGVYLNHRCTITAKGRIWLSNIIGRTPLRVVPEEEFISLLKPKVLSIPNPAKNLPSTSSKGSAKLSRSSAPDINRELRKVRSKLATLFGAVPYLVASARALQQLAEKQPTTMEELKNIRLDGYSNEKTERFGPVFLKVIREYRAKVGYTIQMEKKKPVEQATSTVDQSPLLPLNLKLEPVLKAFTKPSTSSDSKVISLLSDDEDTTSNGETKLQSKAEPLPIVKIKMEKPDHKLDPSQDIDETISSSSDSRSEVIEDEDDSSSESEIDINHAFTHRTQAFNGEKNPQNDAEPLPIVKIKTEKPDNRLDPLPESAVNIEPPPPTIIVIESDIDDTTSVDGEANDDEGKLLNVRKQSENSELDVLLNVMKRDDMSQEIAEIKKPWVFNENTQSAVIKFENEANSDVDCFDGTLNSDTDESNLTEVLDNDKEELKDNTNRSSVSVAVSTSAKPIESNTNVEKSDLDLLVDAFIHRDKKPRIIGRRRSEVFEYEDDSSSESEIDIKPVVSHRKRVLPSWMQISSNKKKKNDL